ncbi:hypothetical protein [Belliella aquatica]|uniref:Glycosyltransferase RgtA/B/C/D-like domain-containing protein n=1 Tax=Belliella aquatica TaxID=1323734 RepID=A0ABQ1LYD7_9BACT|nr:hypothetical protein [Belliella aquatica]GGC31757.1 hypothetical protein GCM10010993_08400 [Belliella aquatica]
MAFAFIFTQYLNDNGGDALRYWTLTADTSQNAQTWTEHWGHRTFFIQWLNYIPSKILNLNFLTGNLLYAAAAFIGIRILYKSTFNYISNGTSTKTLIFLIWIFCFPNLHFWTAGVGKEALLFTAIMLALEAFNRDKINLFLALIAILLAWWIRPITGAILALTCFISFILNKNNSLLHRNIALGLFLILGGLAAYKLTIMMHLEEYSWQAFLDFSGQQMAFLQNLNANSEIPMQDYNALQKTYALFLRPDWTDVTNFWTFAAAVENTTFILLIAVATFSYFKHKTFTLPKTITWGLFFGLSMMLIYAFTLNNLGIITRMKSTYMIFFYIATAFVIFAIDKHSKVCQSTDLP